MAGKCGRGLSSLSSVDRKLQHCLVVVAADLGSEIGYLAQISFRWHEAVIMGASDVSFGVKDCVW